MNKELAGIFFIASIIIFFGHEHAAIAEDLPLDQNAEIARLQQLTNPHVVPAERLAETNAALVPLPSQTSEAFIAKLAESQNHNLKDIRGVAINEYINSKV